jgi:hypothetical protein
LLTSCHEKIVPNPEYNDYLFKRNRFNEAKLSQCNREAEDNPMSGTNNSDNEEYDTEYIDDEEGEPGEDFKKTPATIRLPPPNLAKLIADPWPKTVLFVTIIGFIIVLFTPHATWSIWNWTLIATYGLITVSVIASPYCLRIWYEGEGWLRAVGIGNLIIMNGSVIAATIDTLLWVSLGSGLIPGFEAGNVLMVCFIIVIFLAYSLYFAYRFLTGEAKT